LIYKSIHIINSSTDIIIFTKNIREMRDPKQCKSIDEIREGIDDIDIQIIELLSKRLDFVKEIVKFKIDEEDIVASSRQKEVIRLRRKWAENKELDPDLIENIYKALMQFNIQKELKIFRNEE
jgi:isochorismate pyruvate lyase